jgi:hypothetical protein
MASHRQLLSDLPSHNRDLCQIVSGAVKVDYVIRGGGRLAGQGQEQQGGSVGVGAVAAKVY